MKTDNAGLSTISQNDAGTCALGDTNGTQARSPSDHGAVRRNLITLRNKVGASTPRGQTISNVIEQIENLQTYVRPSWATDERQTLPYMLKQQLARLEVGS